MAKEANIWGLYYNEELDRHDKNYRERNNNYTIFEQVKYVV